MFAWLGDWYGRDGARGCGFLNAAAELPDRDDAARLVVSREKDWLLDLLSRLVREAGVREPDRLASQLGARDARQGRPRLEGDSRAA